MKGAKLGKAGRNPRSVAPGVILGVLFVSVVLVVWPFGLDQFLLPKNLLLGLGVPLAAAILFVQRARDDGARIDKPLVVLVIAFSTWSIVGPYWYAQNRELHVMGSGKVLLMAMLFGVALMARQGAGTKSRDRFVQLIALQAVVVASMAVLQSVGLDPFRAFLDLSSSRPGRWQVLTTLGNPTWTAEVVALTCPFVMVALAGIPLRANRARMIQALVAVMLIAGISVTGSRGGLVCLAVCASLFWRLASTSPHSKRTTLIAMGVGGAVIGSASLLAWTAGSSRFLDIEPITGRFAMWAAGTVVFADAPMTGAGLGHTVLVLPAGLRHVTAEAAPSVHHLLPTVLVDRFDNDWIQVAVERGIPGGLLLAALWLRAFFLSVRRARGGESRFDAAVSASLLGTGLCSVFSAPLHTPATAAFFWILIGLSATNGRDGKKGESTPHGKQLLWFVPAASCCIVVALAGPVVSRIAAANSRAGDGHRALAAGDAHASVAHFQNVLEIMPWSTDATISFARALVASGQPEHALVVIDDGKKWAASQWFWAVEAQALTQLGLTEQARRVIDEGLKVLPRSPVLLEAQEKLFP